MLHDNERRRDVKMYDSEVWSLAALGGRRGGGGQAQGQCIKWVAAQQCLPLFPLKNTSDGAHVDQGALTQVLDGAQRGRQDLLGGAIANDATWREREA